MKFGVVLLLFFSSFAMALTLDEARQQGRVGETLSGYIAPVKQDSETLALVQRINDGRKMQYETLAKNNNLKTAEVGRIAGLKLVERAEKGTFVRGINGQWMQKE